MNSRPNKHPKRSLKDPGPDKLAALIISVLKKPQDCLFCDIMKLTHRYSPTVSATHARKGQMFYDFVISI